MFARYQNRSVLNFLVLAVFAIATTLFLIKKANDAIAEIKELNNMPLYLGKDLNN